MSTTLRRGLTVTLRRALREDVGTPALRAHLLVDIFENLACLPNNFFADMYLYMISRQLGSSKLLLVYNSCEVGTQLARQLACRIDEQLYK